jgi:hypothetical protein
MFPGPRTDYVQIKKKELTTYLDCGGSRLVDLDNLRLEIRLLLLKLAVDPILEFYRCMIRDHTSNWRSRM